MAPAAADRHGRDARFEIAARQATVGPTTSKSSPRAHIIPAQHRTSKIAPHTVIRMWGNSRGRQVGPHLSLSLHKHLQTTLRLACTTGTMDYVKICEARTADELVEAAVALDPDAVSSFEQMTPRALGGSLEASQAFVRSLRLFVDEVSEATDPHGALKEAGYRQTLLLRGLSAPLTGWVGSFGFGRGVAASVAASARELMPLSMPIASPSGLAPEVVAADVVEFQRRVLAALRLDDDPLVVIGRELQLNKAEMGELFGVSRQAVSEWMDTGVPSARIRDVSQVLKVVSILSRKLKSGRTSLVVRRPAPALGGQTLLEAMRHDPENALAHVEEAFDWSGVA